MKKNFKIGLQYYAFKTSGTFLYSWMRSVSKISLNFSTTKYCKKLRSFGAYRFGPNFLYPVSPHEFGLLGSFLRFFLRRCPFWKVFEAITYWSMDSPTRTMSSSKSSILVFSPPNYPYLEMKPPAYSAIS